MPCVQGILGNMVHCKALYAFSEAFSLGEEPLTIYNRIYLRLDARDKFTRSHTILLLSTGRKLRGRWNGIIQSSSNHIIILMFRSRRMAVFVCAWILGHLIKKKKKSRTTGILYHTMILFFIDWVGVNSFLGLISSKGITRFP